MSKWPTTTYMRQLINTLQKHDKKSTGKKTKEKIIFLFWIKRKNFINIFGFRWLWHLTPPDTSFTPGRNVALENWIKDFPRQLATAVSRCKTCAWRKVHSTSASNLLCSQHLCASFIPVPIDPGGERCSGQRRRCRGGGQGCDSMIMRWHLTGAEAAGGGIQGWWWRFNTMQKRRWKRAKRTELGRANDWQHSY